MKLLFIHSKYIRYQAKKKTKIAEDVDKKEDELTDCLVVFITRMELEETSDTQDAENPINAFRPNRFKRFPGYSGNFSFK